MEKYSSYKPTSIQWFKEIPSHWEERRHKYCLPMVKEHSSLSYKVGLENIESFSGRFVPTESSYEGDGMDAKEGDILYGKLRPYLAKVWITDKPCNAVGDFFVYRCNEDCIIKHYAKWLMLSDGFTQICSASTYGAKMPRVSSDFIASLYIPLPPLVEQKKIVSYLESRTSKIDAYVADKEKEILFLQELKQKTIAEAVTKGLNPNVKMKDSGISWIGIIPEHWEIKRVGSFLRERKEKYNRNESLQILSLLKDVGVIPYEDKGNVGNKAKEDISTYKITRKGDVVVNCMNVIIGSSGITNYDGYISPAYYSFIPIDKDTSILYKHWLSLPHMQGAIRCMAKGILEIRLRVSVHQLLSMKIPIPPKREMTDILLHIEEKCQKIDTLITELQAEIDYLKEYKQRLIADVVTGQVNVQNETI